MVPQQVFFLQKDVENFLDFVNEGFTESRLRDVFTRFLHLMVPPLYEKRRMQIAKTLPLEIINFDASYRMVKKSKIAISRPPFILGIEPEGCKIGETVVALIKVTTFCELNYLKSFGKNY